jgi:hypothetical protein
MRKAWLLVLAAGLAGGAEAPRWVTVEGNTRGNPPAWAALERRLIDTMSHAALGYYSRYTASGGTLKWKREGLASLDDLPESFYNFALLYALGGDARLKELSFRAWNATTRQLTTDFPIYYKEFPKYGDWFHIGEGIMAFYFLPLADPDDPETIARARRYAGFYLNEDLEAQNYDPGHRMMRAGENGSLGPLLDWKNKMCPCILPPWYGSMPPEPYVRSLTEPPPYLWTKEMAGYGLPLEDVEGIRTPDDLREPDNARRMGVEVMRRLYPGDVPINLASTSLATNAWILTGDDKYARWVQEYVGAWLDRTRANGGITPDNVGPSGKVGELMNGKWWGGLYGWRWPHGYHSVGQALQIAASNAMLASGGDARYLEMPRSTMEALLKEGREAEDGWRVPTQRSAQGWFAYRPMERSYLASLWFLSQAEPDRARIESVRQREKREWGTVEDQHNKMDAGHDGPWLRYLAGAFPEYPERMLASACGQVAARMARINEGWMLLDTDPARWSKAEPGKEDMTKVSEHHWQSVNPVTTEALVQLMLGAPQVQYNGGLLYATLRYFDPGRKRPGLPRDVAALVRKIGADGVEFELVNLSATEPREVLVQAGTWGEHSFTTVRYERASDEEQAARQRAGFVPRAAGSEKSAEVNAKVFAVRLPAGGVLALRAGLKRYANRPTYAMPWQ